MATTIIPQNIKAAVRSKYAWPGGYPLFMITSDGSALCIDCTKLEWRNVARAIVSDDTHCGWRVEVATINYEDPALYCDHCNERIESAYAEPEVDFDAHKADLVNQ